MRDGPVQQLLKVGLVERLEDVELTTGQQRTDDLEGRVLGGGTDECDDALLDGAEQRVRL